MCDCCCCCLGEGEPLLWAGEDGLGDQVGVRQVAPRIAPRGALFGSGSGTRRTAVPHAATASDVLHHLVGAEGVTATAPAWSRRPNTAIVKRTAAGLYRTTAAAHRVRTAAEVILFRAGQGGFEKFAHRH